MQYPKLRQRKRRTDKRRFSPALEGKENEFGARENRSAPEHKQEHRHLVRSAGIDNVAHQTGPRYESHVDDTQRTEGAGGNRGNDEQPALLRDTSVPADER